MHPIPSVIDLPSAGGVGIEVGGIGSGVQGSTYGDTDMKIRPVNGNANGHGFVDKNGFNSSANIPPSTNTSNSSDKERAGKDGQRENVKHYDADGMCSLHGVLFSMFVHALFLLDLCFRF